MVISQKTSIFANTIRYKIMCQIFIINIDKSGIALVSNLFAALFIELSLQLDNITMFYYNLLVTYALNAFGNIFIICVM